MSYETNLDSFRDGWTCLNMFDFLCGTAQMRLWRDPQCNQRLLSMGTGAVVLATCSFWHHLSQFKTANPRQI